MLLADQLVTATWFLVGATIFLGVVAAFQDRIRALIWRPKLQVSANPQPPDCHLTTLDSIVISSGALRARAPCLYYRIQVKNVGRDRAEKVEVFAAKLDRRLADGRYQEVTSFLPMNLVWAHIGGPVKDGIAPGIWAHCDLGHILEPSQRGLFPGEETEPPTGKDKTIFSLDTVVKPNTRMHLLEPSHYRMTIRVAAANARPTQRVIEISHTGDWYSDEARMLSQGTRIALTD